MRTLLFLALFSAPSFAQDPQIDLQEARRTLKGPAFLNHAVGVLLASKNVKERDQALTYLVLPETALLDWPQLKEKEALAIEARLLKAVEGEKDASKRADLIAVLTLAGRDASVKKLTPVLLDKNTDEETIYALFPALSGSLSRSKTATIEEYADKITAFAANELDKAAQHVKERADHERKEFARAVLRGLHQGRLGYAVGSRAALAELKQACDELGKDCPKPVQSLIGETYDLAKDVIGRLGNLQAPIAHVARSLATCKFEEIPATLCEEAPKAAQAYLRQVSAYGKSMARYQKAVEKSALEAADLVLAEGVRAADEGLTELEKASNELNRWFKAAIKQTRKALGTDKKKK